MCRSSGISRGGIHTDVTYFLNLGHNYNYDKNLNMTDPNIAYTYKAATSASVPNPFYNILTPQLFPGSLRYQQNVSVSAPCSPHIHSIPRSRGRIRRVSTSATRLSR